jgi:hypothetical protein
MSYKINKCRAYILATEMIGLVNNKSLKNIDNSHIKHF